MIDACQHSRMRKLTFSFRAVHLQSFVGYDSAPLLDLLSFSHVQHVSSPAGYGVQEHSPQNSAGHLCLVGARAFNYVLVMRSVCKISFAKTLALTLRMSYWQRVFIAPTEEPDVVSGAGESPDVGALVQHRY